jgi:hypothetical protein
LAEIICCRHANSVGAVAKCVGKQLVRAVSTTEPKDDCQAALLAAMRGEQFGSPKRIGFFD